RFWFTGLVFVFLLADITSPVAAQSRQPSPTAAARRASSSFSTPSALSTSRRKVTTRPAPSTRAASARSMRPSEIACDRQGNESAINIFPSYIFLLAKPKQKNVGGKTTDGSVLKSTVDGRNDDQNQGHSGHV